MLFRKHTACNKLPSDKATKSTFFYKINLKRTTVLCLVLCVGGFLLELAIPVFTLEMVRLITFDPLSCNRPVYLNEKKVEEKETIILKPYDYQKIV